MRGWCVVGVVCVACGADVTAADGGSDGSALPESPGANDCPHAPEIAGDFWVEAVDVHGDPASVELIVRVPPGAPQSLECEGRCEVVVSPQGRATIVGIDSTGCARLTSGEGHSGWCEGWSINGFLQFDERCGQACPEPRDPAEADVNLVDCLDASCREVGELAAFVDLELETRRCSASLRREGATAEPSWALLACHSDAGPESSLAIEWSTTPSSQLSLVEGEPIRLEVLSDGRGWMLRRAAGDLVALHVTTPEALWVFEASPQVSLVDAPCDAQWDGKTYTAQSQVLLGDREQPTGRVDSGSHARVPLNGALFDVVAPTLLRRVSMTPKADDAPSGFQLAIARRE